MDGTDLYSLRDEERSRLRNERIGLIPQGHTALRSPERSLTTSCLPSDPLREGRAAARSRRASCWTAVGLGDLARCCGPPSCRAASCGASAMARALLMDPEPSSSQMSRPPASIARNADRLSCTLLRDAADRGSSCPCRLPRGRGAAALRTAATSWRTAICARVSSWAASERVKCERADCPTCLPMRAKRCQRGRLAP